MNITKQTPRVSRMILGATVQVPQPFVAGPHELTAGEASALNQTLWENVRNNSSAKVEPIKADPAAVQALLDDAFKSYEFGVRKPGAGRGAGRDPARTEAINLARTALKRKINESGKDLPAKEAFNEMVLKLVDGDPKWLEAGRTIVESRAAVGAKLAA